MEENIVHVVDDDRASLSLMKNFLDTIGIKSYTYSSAESFLASYDGTGRSCLVLDLQMPDMTGLELQQEINDRGNNLPIIFISGYGEVPEAVEAMKAGAIDFFQKPYNLDKLRVCIEDVFQHWENRFEQSSDKTFNDKVSLLTPREHEVMQLLAESKSNKEIARSLSISPRTVEVHRKNVMNKLEIKSVVELVRYMN